MNVIRTFIKGAVVVAAVYGVYRFAKDRIDINIEEAKEAVKDMAKEVVEDCGKEVVDKIKPSSLKEAVTKKVGKSKVVSAAKEIIDWVQLSKSPSKWYADILKNNVVQYRKEDPIQIAITNATSIAITSNSDMCKVRRAEDIMNLIENAVFVDDNLKSLAIQNLQKILESTTSGMTKNKLYDMQTKIITEY